MSDDVRWFDELGRCRECPKPATGVLRGSRNDSYGPYCKPCAERRLNRAEADRRQEKDVQTRSAHLGPVDMFQPRKSS